MGSRWTLSDVRAHQAKHALPVTASNGRGEMSPPPDQKYKNKIVVMDGITFDSKKEGDHYLLLKMRERLQEIEHLDLQPVFPIYIDTPDRGRISIGVFKADFRYWEHYCGSAILRVVDVKSPVTKTEAYQLRKKLVEALYNITITEV